jgi:hypothetical protein
MKKRLSAKQHMILSFSVLAMVFASVFVVIRSKPAQAICDNPINSIISLAVWIADALQYIQSFDDGLQNFISVDIQTGQDETQQRVEEFDENTREGFSEWWNAHFRPALQDMTAQLSTAKIDESKARLSMHDAQMQQELQRIQMERQADSHHRLEPSEYQSCRLDSSMPSVGKRLKVSRNISRALGNDARPRGTADLGTPESFGPTAVTEDKWQQYQKYCDAQANAGGAACPTDSPIQNADISIGSAILWGEQMSIDLTIPQNQELFEDAKRNFVDQNPPEPILEVNTEDPDGIDEFNEMRSNAARKQAIHTVLGRLMASRVAGPVGEALPDIQALRIAAGADPAVASLTPSAHEIMHALTKDAVMRPDFFEELVNNPNALLKDTVGTRTLQMQQSNLMYRRLEELSVMLASEYARDLENNDPGDGREEAPAQ